MPRTKLTEKEVKAMRKEYATGRVQQKMLAWKYGVSRPTISHIVNRRTWRHVE